MNTKTHARPNGTGPLDPALARALFFVELDTVELTARIPQAEPGDGQHVY